MCSQMMDSDNERVSGESPEYFHCFQGNETLL